MGMCPNWGCLVVCVCLSLSLSLSFCLSVCLSVRARARLPQYTGHMADGDPLYSPPEGWEPPIEYHDSAYLPEAANAAPDSPLLERMSGMKTNPYA
jgi:hypothetical protein